MDYKQLEILIKFFKTNIIQLKYLNQFFKESKNRGDI